MKNGISKTGKELTQQQKLQARYGAIMEQTAKAQGDLARTMDSPTNQLRRLTAEFDMAKIALGQALQPALLSVLPVLTSFATGLTRVMTGAGITTGNPFDDVVISLAEATASVKSGLSTLTADTVAEVNRQKAEVESALTAYATAANETKSIVLNLTLKPQTSAYERVLEELRKLDALVGVETRKGIQADVQLQMDAVLKDGVVTQEEIDGTLALIKAKTDPLIANAKMELVAKQADIKLRLETGAIDATQAHIEVQAAQDAYDRDVGIINGLIAYYTAELTPSDWKANSLSANDKGVIHQKLQAELLKAQAVALQAKATVSPLFAGTGNIGLAVDQVYQVAVTELDTLGGELNALFTQALQDGVDIDWAKVSELRQEMADIISFITSGITPKGAFDKAKFDLKTLTPSTLGTFAKSYKDTIKTMVDAEKSLLKQREDMLFSLQGEELDKALADMGFKDGFDAAIIELRQMQADASNKIQSDLLTSAVNALTPGIRNIMANTKDQDYSNIIGLQANMKSLLGAIDPAALSGDAKKQYEALSAMADQLEALASWLDATYQNPEVRNLGMNGVNTPTFAPGSRQNSRPSYDLELYKPVIKTDPFVNFSGYGANYSQGGRGGQFNVTIEPTNIAVTMMLDEYVVGKANIVAHQTVTKTTGATYNPHAPMINQRD